MGFPRLTIVVVSLTARFCKRWAGLLGWVWISAKPTDDWIIRPREHGTFHVTGQGHLRIPAALRHRCGLEPGDRVLLAADPRQRQLVAYPPAALDALIGGHAADSLDGEPV
jgi:bifunctional DNA-binding transcriptional regulator/antitoxin component of YhaV-PrlF toxin-antitoxin module